MIDVLPTLTLVDESSGRGAKGAVSIESIGLLLRSMDVSAYAPSNVPLVIRRSPHRDRSIVARAARPESHRSGNSPRPGASLSRSSASAVKPANAVEAMVVSA